MATTTIPWGDGSGDNIYLTYSSASGDQTVSVSSDANTGDERTKTVTFATTVGSVSQSLVVTQESGEAPGSRVTDYVQDGLVLHMDGKRGKTANSWTSVVGSVVFDNHSAIMNADNVEIDGVGYLSNTSFTSPSSANTIEVACEVVGKLFDQGQPVFMPKTNGRSCFIIIASSKKILHSSGSTNRNSLTPTLGKATFSLSPSLLLQNGKTMSNAGNAYAARASSTYNYIGHRTDYCAKIKIYSIRVYNREITAEEAATNLAVDRLRFRGTEPYISFTDSVLGGIAADYWGDGIGITASQALSVYESGSIFQGSAIELFSEIETYFTNLTVLSANAFNGCSSLIGNVVIPSSIISIGSAALRGLSSISNLYCYGGGDSSYLDITIFTNTATNGVVYISKPVIGTTSQPSHVCKKLIIGGYTNSLTASRYIVGRYNLEELRIWGNYYNAGDVGFVSTGRDNTKCAIKFIELSGKFTSTTGKFYGANGMVNTGTIVHLAYDTVTNNELPCTPANVNANAPNISKIYVGDGSSQAHDQAILDMYIADTDWSAYSSKLDLWYNYSGDYKTPPTIPPDPAL